MTELDPRIVEIIDQKVKENVSKAIETVQISLLREHFLTREEFLNAMKKIDERFEAMDKRFEAMQKQIDKRFAKVYERLDQMSFGHTDIVEGVAYIVIKREFRARGLEFELTKKHHFTDKDYVVYPDTQDVEIDIFHIKPNILGEITLKITEIENVRSFIRKIQFIEKRYRESFQKYFFCYYINDNIKADVEMLLKQYNIELIIPEQEESF